MKDKEKQIEEMTKDLYGEIDYNVNYYSDDNYSEVDFDYKETAKNIVEKGWVKLPKDSVVLTRKEYEKLKTQLKIKTNEAEWRAVQLQALDKNLETMERVVKCKDCKWLEEKHYEEGNEKPYIKLVCKLTKRQCKLYDFCSYGEQ